MGKVLGATIIGFGVAIGVMVGYHASFKALIKKILLITKLENIRVIGKTDNPATNHKPLSIKSLSLKITVWDYIFWGCLLVAVLFRIYKAHNTGIIFDEVWTYEDYCRDLRTAITNYYTNNHVLNSVFIVLTEKLLGGYDHFLRIPAVIFGIIFCGAVAIILRKTVSSRLLQITAILLILMNWFILDLSYLGRGYAIGLGAAFAGITALIHLCRKENDNEVYRWRVVFFFIVMNFLALGAMLSSLPILVSINIFFVVWLLLDSRGKGKDMLHKAYIRLATIGLGTAVSLYLFYRPALPEIRRLSKVFKVSEPFGVYMKQVLWQPLVFREYHSFEFNNHIYKAALALLLICVIICAVRAIIKLRKGLNFYSLLCKPGFQVVLLSIATLIIMWFQRVIMDVSLGMPRNGVFLLALILPAAVIIMDKTISTIRVLPAIRYILVLVCLSVTVFFCFRNWPSGNAVQVHPHGWAIESSMGPLVRILHDIDSKKVWKIKLTEYTKHGWRPIRYYKNRGYNIELVEGKDFDVWVVPKTPASSRVICIANDRFIEHHCCIIANPPSFEGRPIFYEVKRAAPRR